MNWRDGVGGMAALLAAAFAPPVVAQLRTVDRLVLEDDVRRLTAIALLERLNADLLASRSATSTLEKWCADHALAQPATIVAENDGAARNPVTAEQRRRLAVGPDETVRYRRVKLKCGDLVLSEAENWYVPSRLTREMNALLDETRTPFGKVVRPLGPRRETFALVRHWALLTRDALAAVTPGAAPDNRCDTTVFSHSALVLNDRNEPIAEVKENYKLALVCGLL